VSLFIHGAAKKDQRLALELSAGLACERGEVFGLVSTQRLALLGFDIRHRFFVTANVATVWNPPRFVMTCPRNFSQ
jgi:hypothetical protein